MERTLAWDDGAVVAIDQCALPAVYRTLRRTSVDDVIDAIVRLAIRGAPAGSVAAPGGERLGRVVAHHRGAGAALRGVRHGPHRPYRRPVGSRRHECRLRVRPRPGRGRRALAAARRDGFVVRALAITSPSNPIGHVHPATVLRDLVIVAATHSVDVIADEIYAHSAFGAEFVSMVGEQAVHGIWGFAKDSGLSGFKVGVMHPRDPEVRTAARALTYFAPVSNHTQALVTNLPSDAGWVAAFLAENRRRLRTSATAAMDLLAAGSIGYLEPDGGGFSLWIDLRPYLPTLSAAAEHALWQRILRSARAKILPGTAFACPEPGWFRLCQATDASTVATGINRLIRALETS